MGIFSRRSQAAFAAEPEAPSAVQAAVGAGGSMPYYSWNGSYLREQAIAIPTISRARDLIVSLISGLPLLQYQLAWDAMENEYSEIQIPSEPWFSRPDPSVTRQFILAWTVDDLIFQGRAHWLITSRSKVAPYYPLSFQWIPAADVTLPNMAGPLYWGKPTEIQFLGQPLNPNDVITFLSPIQGLLRWALARSKFLTASTMLQCASLLTRSRRDTCSKQRQANLWTLTR